MPCRSASKRRCVRRARNRLRSPPETLTWSESDSRLPVYSSTPNTNNDNPDTIDTYCLPPMRYVIGALLIEAPSCVFHNNSPVRALSAWKYPSRPPVNSRSEPVVRMPASVTSVILNFHFSPPLPGSSAMTAPCPAASVHVLIGARPRPGAPGTADRFRGPPPTKFVPVLYSEGAGE